MKIQPIFNKVAQTIENSQAAERATQRINNFATKIANNSRGDLVDTLIVSGKMACEVPRTLFETIVEVTKNIIRK